MFIDFTLKRRYRCFHRSHRLHLPCFRCRTYDYQCGKHNTTCFHGCPPTSGDVSPDA